MSFNFSSIAVIGLGYVGLPLAVAFGKEHETLGFDINTERVAELLAGEDSTLEVSTEELAGADHLSFSSDPASIAPCQVFIVTVPTPVNQYRQPDLEPLSSASRTVGKVLKKGDTVIYESTVFPGATEEVCVPILESESGLIHNEDFFTGYSPERINPGDKQHRLADIVKVTSGSNPEVANNVDALYREIISAGTHKASSIKVAEAAKVIENTQRDLNIALVNELALIFERLNIDTLEVLEAAGTKWNFLPFRPGLVGGHCISVDPYYLTHKAGEIGYHPRVILAGREINDGMGEYVAGQVVKLMTMKRIHVVESRILVLGFAFKENCPDLRNTRVIDIIESLCDYNACVDVYDPWISEADTTGHYQINLVKEPAKQNYDAIILAVAHDEFVGAGIDGIRAFGKENCVLYDVKSVLPSQEVDARL